VSGVHVIVENPTDRLPIGWVQANGLLSPLLLVESDKWNSGMNVEQLEPSRVVGKSGSQSTVVIASQNAHLANPSYIIYLEAYKSSCGMVATDREGVKRCKRELASNTGPRRILENN